MPDKNVILRCALPTPVDSLFDYLPPAIPATQEFTPGQRLRVPFGSRQLTALIVSIENETAVAEEKLRRAAALLDEEPLFDEQLMKLMLWMSQYYHHALGELAFNFVPALLRQGRAAEIQGLENSWRLSTRGLGLAPDALKRAPKQAALLALLRDKELVFREDLDAAGISSSIVNTLLKKEYVQVQKQAPNIDTAPAVTLEAPLTLDPQQQNVIDAMATAAPGYHCVLLHGVTGSGKTEVYMHLIAEQIESGRQVLVLVPEIGLTPQLVHRFEKRFGRGIVALHSNLTDIERHNNWLGARATKADIVIGTRSAVLTPLPKLGLIIVDEEHDGSFKQQEGLRYSARDIAIKRAQLSEMPILLGSATPSFHSLQNADTGRYQFLDMPERAADSVLPNCRLCDCRGELSGDGIALELQQAIRSHIQAGSQVMVFINRRGFAPTLLCEQCSWIAKCTRCEARLTAHRAPDRLICHHCEQETAWPSHCPECKRAGLTLLGAGTQRSEDLLQSLFPDTTVVRIDRDSTQKKGALQRQLERVATGEPCILLGTQMLAKGHHFPNIALVAILDADQALYSADFRGAERMAQTIVQVAGRAGRGSVQGEVLIQTQMPDHPIWEYILSLDYLSFAREQLQERQTLKLPPYSRFAALFGEYRELETLLAHMRALLDGCQSHLPKDSSGFLMVGPMPAPLVRKANRFRAQAMFYCENSAHMHKFLAALRYLLGAQRLPNGMRLHIDVDPIDTN